MDLEQSPAKRFKSAVQKKDPSAALGWRRDLRSLRNLAAQDYLQLYSAQKPHLARPPQQELERRMERSGSGPMQIVNSPPSTPESAGPSASLSPPQLDLSHFPIAVQSGDASDHLKELWRIFQRAQSLRPPLAVDQVVFRTEDLRRQFPHISPPKLQVTHFFCFLFMTTLTHERNRY